MRFQHHDNSEAVKMVNFVHAMAMPALLKELRPIHQIHFEEHPNGSRVLSVYRRGDGRAAITVERSPRGLLKYSEGGIPRPDADLMAWDLAETRKPLEDEMTNRLNAQCLDQFGAETYFQTVGAYRLELDDGIRRMAKMALSSIVQATNYPLPRGVDTRIRMVTAPIFGTEPLTTGSVNYLVRNGRALDAAERECPGSVAFRYCYVDHTRSPVSVDSILESVAEALPDAELRDALPFAMLDLVGRRKVRVLGPGLTQQVEAYCRLFRDCRRAGLSPEAAQQSLGVAPTVPHHFCDLGDDAWLALRDTMVLYGQQNVDERNSAHLELMFMLENLERDCRRGRVPKIMREASTWQELRDPASLHQLRKDFRRITT